jgi:prepilin-type N-terminal cleavage/methylation domain-containing protein
VIRLREHLDGVRRDESGFTLIELLVATVIGMVIILAAYGLADSSVRAFGKADNRADVTQRGRLGLDAMSRTLRSQTCPTGASSTSTNIIGSFVSATDLKAVFWADLGRKATTVRPIDPSLDGFSYANGTISELSYAANASTGTETAVPVITSVVPNNGPTATPETVLFKYYSFNPNYDPTVTDTTSSAYGLYKQLATPVVTSSLDDIVKVQVSFKTYPRKGTAADRTTAIFSDETNLRTADISRRSAPAC